MPFSKPKMKKILKLSSPKPSYKSIFQLLITFLLLTPLFFINLNDTHDWGGDFAQYIQQAINIVEGKAQYDTHYIFNPDYAILAPPAYPVGFPILLSPVYALFGNSILAFTTYISLILVATLMATFKFLKHYYGFISALVATLIFAYNPWVLNFKGEVVSDIPFTFFLISSLLLFIKRSQVKRKLVFHVIIGCLVGFAMLIKSIGFVIVFAFVLEYIIEFLFVSKESKKEHLKQNLKLLLVLVLSCLSMYICLSELIFPIKNESYGFFVSLFKFKDLGDTLLTTSGYYVNIFQKFFHPDVEKWRFAALITKAFLLTFLIVGFFLKSLQKIRAMEILFISYLGVIFSFPNTSQGFRYLLPVFPIMIYYIIHGISSIKLTVNIKKAYFALFFLIAIGLQYKRDINKIIKQSDKVINGPQHPLSKELFLFIKNETQEDDRFVFTKPRVFGLYASRDCYTNNEKTDNPTAEIQLNKLGFDYIVTCTDLKNKPLGSYLKTHKSKLKEVFKNKKFTIYQNKK